LSALVGKIDIDDLSFTYSKMVKAKMNQSGVGVELNLAFDFVFKLHSGSIDLLEYLHLNSVVLYSLPVHFGELGQRVLEFALAYQDLNLLQSLFNLPP
jgi:hypothetical protein